MRDFLFIHYQKTRFCPSYQKNSSPQSKCPVTHPCGVGWVLTLRRKYFLNDLEDRREISPAWHTESRSSLKWEQETFSGNHPQLPSYVTWFISRADVTRLPFKAAHLLTNVSYTFTVTTSKCTLTKSPHPARRKVTGHVLHHSGNVITAASSHTQWLVLSPNSTAAVWQVVLDKQKAFGLLLIQINVTDKLSITIAHYGNWKRRLKCGYQIRYFQYVWIELSHATSNTFATSNIFVSAQLVVLESVYSSTEEC